MNKQGRQCTYDVTTSRVRATTAAVENQLIVRILRVCVCSLSYLACHIVTCGLPGFAIFSHTISKTARISISVIELKICVLSFSATFACLVIRRYDKKWLLLLMYSVQLLLSDFHET